MLVAPPPLDHVATFFKGLFNYVILSIGSNLGDNILPDKLHYPESLKYSW